MGLPYKLKNHNVFANGSSWLGLVPEIQLPKLAKKVEQYRGGGMLGELDVEMGLEKLETEIKLGGLVRQALRLFGAIGVEGVLLRFVGAYQSDGVGAVMASEMVMGGMFTEFDPGSAKVGDNTEMPVKATLNYLKWSINGRTDVEIDMLRSIWIQDGIDRMAAIRAAIQV
jgi:P2 family phage contractile tail tube protein